MRRKGRENLTGMTCIILAGGNSRRTGGRDKSFLTIDGDTFIERKIRQCAPLFREIIITVKDVGAYSRLPARIIPDQRPEQGPLMGLYSGLLNSSSEINFITTVDSPFMNPTLAAWLVEEIGNSDAHIPRHGKYLEPLFAAYRRSCIPLIRRTLSERKVTSFYKYADVKYAEDDIIRRFDPMHRSFQNINSLEDYRRIVGSLSV